MNVKRKDILNALNTIPGVVAKISKPESPKAGNAWIAAGTFTNDRGMKEATWTIYLMLPQNEDMAFRWYENNEAAIFDGLQHPTLPIESVGFVETISTINLGGTAESPVFGLEITLRSD